MALDQRKRRSPPARTSPQRAMLPGAEPAPDQKPAKPSRIEDAPAGEDAAAAAAVKVAYAVVDENIAEGRRAAARLRAAAPPVAGPAPDARAVANRLLHMTKDLGSTWVDLILALVREPDIRASLDRMSVQATGRAGASVAPAAGVAVVQRVSSRQPIEVSLSTLALSSAATPPRIAGLHSLDAGQTPINRVEFRPRPEGGLELRIDVADGQAAGVYAGTVVDAETQQPIGTLSVRVFT